MLTEEWRLISGWPDYEVSNSGRVRRATPSRCRRYPAGYVLKASIRNKYPAVCFPNGKRSFKSFKVATLVCDAFRGPRPSPAHEVAHEDGNKMNSAAINLNWKTKIENAADKDRHGTTARGEKNGTTSLTEAGVLKIRELVNSEMRPSLRSIAALHGIDLKTVQNIRDRKTWGWLA